MDVDDLVFLIFIVILFIFIGTIIVIALFANGDVIKNKTAECQRLGFDRYMNRGIDGEFCIKDGNAVRVISQCGTDADSCAMIIEGKR